MGAGFRECSGDVVNHESPLLLQRQSPLTEGFIAGVCLIGGGGQPMDMCIAVSECRLPSHEVDDSPCVAPLGISHGLAFTRPG
jgi:hypothetical protein